MRHLWLGGVGLALTLVAGACGADPDGTGADTADADSTQPTLSTTEAPAATVAAEPAILEPSTVNRAPVGADAPMSDVAAAFNEVGWALWHTPGLAADDNAVISPSSIGHALLMARAAADEPTAAAIDAALGLPDGLAAHQGWNAIDRAMVAAAAAEEELTVTLADRIWPRLEVTPGQEWIDVLAAYHGADVQPLDFAGDPAGSRDVINGWIGDRTEGLIPELLPEGFIEPAKTLLVLTDAVYFEARWARLFGKYGPVDGEFRLLDGSSVDVELMQELELSSSRGRGDGYVGAEIPYVGNEFSMLVIVPDEGRFGEVRDRLDADLIAEIDANFSTGAFKLLLPKWEDKTEQLDLLPWLTDIGAAPGSYPGIDPGAFLDSAVHGADIAVDEWGTVAAAATALGFDDSGPPEPELVIAADQPFLYVIRHTDSGLILFLGQVTDPT